MKFENLADNIDLCINCRYDVRFKPNNPVLLAEFKSYATATWQNIKNSPKFIQQFKNYLATTDIDAIEKLAYVVNITKATEAEIKLAFKELFLAKKEEIFLAMNQQLKADILGLANVNRIDLFENAINDLNSKLYNFIKTE